MGFELMLSGFTVYATSFYHCVVCAAVEFMSFMCWVFGSGMTKGDANHVFLFSCCSVSKSCLSLWDPMDCSTPGSPVLHYPPEFAQIHVHWIGDTIQSSHSLLPPLFPFAFNLSQHQGPFQWVGSSHQAAKSFGASASASVLPMNIQGWFPLGLTGLISLLSKLHLWIKSNVSFITWISLFIISVKILSQVYSIWSVSQFSHSVMSDSLRPHGLQQARPPCPSPTPGVYSDSHPLSQWCHPTISSSAVCFSCPQTFPASGSFQMSHLFASGDHSIGVSASASVFPMHIQDWFPLGWTGWISLQSKGLSRVFSNTTVQKHQFFSTQLCLSSNSHIHTWVLEKP